MSGTDRRHVRATHPAPAVYADSGVWPDRTLGSHLEEAARRSPMALAVVDGGSRLSYGELFDVVLRTTARLRQRNVVSHDVVMIDLPNWWEATVAVHATLRLGAVANPVIPIYREREVGFILRQARPRLVFIPHRFRGFDYVTMLSGLLADAEEAPLVVVVRSDGPLPEGFVSFESLTGLNEDGTEAWVETPDLADPDDVSLLLYTSGTTADPKGVLHTHRTLGYECLSIARLFSLGTDPLFMPSPVTHITGFLFGILLPPMLGVASVLMDVWDSTAAARLIEVEQCGFTMGATPFLQGLVDAYSERSSPCALKWFLCGGADVPPQLVYRAREVLSSGVLRVYGSSEFPTFSCGRPQDPPDVGANTDGLPISHAEGRLDHAEGGGSAELLVRGPEMFLGYLDASLNADAFTADGFFRTGDLASIDDRGAVTIVGRRKDIILRNGENISAKEIEDILYQHAAVQEVAVVAMPDRRTGEKVCAFVVPAAGSAPTLDDLCQYLESYQIARQKLPEWLELVNELPITASGKVQKFVLRERARSFAL